MIQLEDVHKHYSRRGGDTVHALDGISLTIPTGRIHGIVGESGAGKSTLMRCLTALEKPTSGRVLIDGNDLSRLSQKELRQARRKIGMVFQGANLLDSRTAAGNIAYPLKINGNDSASTRKRVAEMLSLVGLADRARSFPSELSGGQRQRVGIARAMADSPSVLLCDEPTSALDTETTDQILALLSHVRDEYGVTIVIITHEMNVVRRICDDVTLLENGKITSSGSVAEVVSDVDSPLAEQIIPAPFVSQHTDLTTALIDVAFTSHPGEPTGSQVLGISASLGADISAGTFETIGQAQVARLALSVPHDNLTQAMKQLEAAGVSVKVREQ